jgi:tRNA(Ile)-lysidine synthase
VIHAERIDPIARALRSSFHDDTVVAAVSGGPDSMAMLHALCVLARERKLRVVVAHFDHQLRPHSHDDVALVRRMADQLGVPVVTGLGDVRAYAIKTRQSLEAAGRVLRYAFLEDVADRAGADAIVTAHTRDDQVETVLMRILRGAGARGCRGILARRGRVVRPLLPVARADTHEYCRVHGVPSIDDPSNFDTRYYRNRIRHDVLPDLRRAYPGIDNALMRVAENALTEFQRAETATERRLQVFLEPESERTWVLGTNAFTGLDDPDDRSHLISAALDVMGARNDVTQPHHEQVLGLIDATPGAVANLHGVYVRREYDGLVFMRKGLAVASLVSMHTLTAPGTLDLGGWHIDACHIDAPGAGQLSNCGDGVAYIPCDDMLVVRYPRPGDRMQPFGMKGHKKLSDVFIDRKIPKRRRASTPIIEAGGEIVWVLGVAKSEKCRINDGCGKVVRLTATWSHA